MNLDKFKQRNNLVLKQRELAIWETVKINTYDHAMRYKQACLEVYRLRIEISDLQEGKNGNQTTNT